MVDLSIAMLNYQRVSFTVGLLKSCKTIFGKLEQNHKTGNDGRNQATEITMPFLS